MELIKMIEFASLWVLGYLQDIEQQGFTNNSYQRLPQNIQYQNEVMA